MSSENQINAPEERAQHGRPSISCEERVEEAKQRQRERNNNAVSSK